jgi:anti-sigma-K factor RskA
MTAHDSLRELAPDYALGLLDEPARRDFEAHLETCAECTNEVRSLALVAEGLGRSVPQLAPPAALRDRVRAIATDRDEPARNFVVRERRGAPWWLAAAAALAIVALGLYAASLQRRLGAVEAELLAIRGAADILIAVDITPVDLAGQPVAPEARGRAYWSPSSGVVFTATNLPPLPAGKTYQLWLVLPSGPVSAGLMPVVEAGRASVATALHVGARPAAVALTIEPAGGVPAPTGDRVLIGSM